MIEDFKERKVKAREIFKIREIDKVTAYDFVRRYHYLADAKFFAKYSYGLYYGFELVGCATYSAPQGSDALKGWFGLPNSDKTVVELTRLCMLPALNHTNATSFLLGGSIRMIKRYGIRAVITLATSDRHVGSIYQVCNFKYYGLTTPKFDFWSYDTQGKPRGKVKDIQGVWVAKPQKHRYAYIIDKKLKCNYAEQTRPAVDMNVAYSCCNGTGIVHDSRYNVDYTCPICTGHLYRIDGRKQVPPRECRTFKRNTHYLERDTMRHYRTHGRIPRWFICPVCRYKTMASKRADRKTSKGHRKSLWCPYCKRVQQFIQISR